MQNYVKQINENSIAVVMNSESNPLNSLPRVQRFQIMAILSIMWTAIFSTALGSWFYYGELVVGHLAVLLGIFITAGVFRTSQQPLKSYRDYPREDGTARYDDARSIFSLQTFLYLVRASRKHSSKISSPSWISASEIVSAGRNLKTLPRTPQVKAISPF